MIRGRLFLYASDLRLHRSKLIQDQCQDRDLFPTERVKRQQRLIDSPQSRLSNHDGGQSHTLHEVQHIGRSRDRDIDTADAFHHHDRMLLLQGTEGT
jgi:hypothetical protein